MAKVFTCDEARQLVAQSLPASRGALPEFMHGAVPSVPYPELAENDPSLRASCYASPIFITGRFRCGSTLLWNLFRHLDCCTAYYEPFNERRWFDPEARGEQVDETHRGVSDYWREYRNMSDLSKYYQLSWTDRHLYMDEHSWDPAMKRYIELLIEHAAGRPVLQFNRIDFRLPWIRHHFPNARIIHIYRHPRDQWCSTLMNIHSFPAEGRVADFEEHDKFYLMSWVRDLKYNFPFLADEVVHPYQLFYYIWRLSYNFGVRYADHSLSLENLVATNGTILHELLLKVGIAQSPASLTQSLISGSGQSRWQQYASESWFRAQERQCETVLAEFFGAVTRTSTPAKSMTAQDIGLEDSFT